MSAIVFAGAGAWALAAASPGPFFGIDFDRWGWDATSLRICLEGGSYPRCGNQTKSPLAYLGMAFLLDSLRERGIEPSQGLRVVNAAMLSLPAAILLWHRPLARGLTAALVYFVLLWATPLPRFYVLSGALEVHQGVFLGLLVVCSIRALQRQPGPGWPLMIATNLLVAIVLLYKDPTLLLLLGGLMLVLLHPRARSLLTRGSLSAAARLWVPGVVLGTAGQAWYNWVRYRTLVPRAYLVEAQATAPTMEHRLEQLFWLVASPNGGLVVFWGLALAVLAAACALLRLRVSRPALGYTLALVAMTLVMMANLPYAFGWDSWGARYTIPAGLALLTASCLTLEARPPAAVTHGTERTALRRASRLASWVVLGVMAVLSGRYVAVGYQLNPGQLFGRSLFDQPACRAMLAAIESRAPEVQGVRFFRSEAYWACARARFLTDPVALAGAE